MAHVLRHLHTALRSYATLLQPFMPATMAALLDQLATLSGFTNVYLTSTDKDQSSGVLAFTVTASITPDALSHRYTVEGK